MPVESNDDLASFFEPDEHAITAVFVNGVGVKISFDGIFDREFAEVDLAEMVVQNREPVMRCATASVAHITEGNVIEIADERFKVRSNEPDGTGVSELHLELLKEPC